MNALSRIVPAAGGLAEEKLAIDVAAVITGCSETLLDQLEAGIGHLTEREQAMIREAITRERTRRALAARKPWRTLADAVTDFRAAFHERRIKAARNARKPYAEGDDA